MADSFSFVSTEKERRILQFLFQVKVATFKQIHDQLFGNIAKSAVSRRLGRLLKAKLIQKAITDFQGKYTQVYLLKAETVDLLFDDSAGAVERYQVQSGAIDHDLILSDIRSHLSTYKKVKRYWTENELQCLKECASNPKLLPFVLLRSDAVMEMRSDGQDFVVPLELEVSRKAYQRYAEKIKHYYERGNLMSVLFISGSSEIQKAVMAVEKQIADGKRLVFYHQLLKDVLKFEEKMEFFNLKQDKFILQ